MAKQFPVFSDRLMAFVHAQPVFFVATAPAAGRVNLSPKGMDSLRVVAPDRVLWLNATGSGNETAAHVLENGRMTLMWCAFTGAPLVLRAYGTARNVHPDDPRWAELYARLPGNPGARQLFELHVDLVQTSCGMAVPLLDYVSDREALNKFAERKGPAGLADYWQEKNAVSIDGLPTDM